MAAMRSERGFDRFVNFSDATVAIAITLLVLPAVGFAGEISHESFGTLISTHWSTLFALALSFAVIASFWVSHHQLLDLAASYDYGMVWLNFLWLFCIILVPFATNLVQSETPTRPPADIFYVAVMFVASSSIGAIGLRLRLHPELHKENVMRDLSYSNILGGPITFAVALLLVASVPSAGLYPLFVLALQWPLRVSWDALARARTQRHASA